MVDIKCLENSAPLASHWPNLFLTNRETPAARDIVLHQTSGRIHNKNVSTHLIGNIKQGKEGEELNKAVLGERRPGPCPHSYLHPPTGHSPETGNSGLFALCTLDGE